MLEWEKYKKALVGKRDLFQLRFPDVQGEDDNIRAAEVGAAEQGTHMEYHTADN